MSCEPHGSGPFGAAGCKTPRMVSDELLTERLLRIIDEGRRTATYKLALLLALVDTVAERPGAEEIPTRAIATHVLERYYPQTRVFVAADGIERELRQISMKGSPVLRAALRLRLLGDGAGCREAAQTAERIPEAYGEALTATEDTFVRYPIPLLQVVGSKVVPFLYEVDWPEGTSAASLRSAGCDRIRLLPGVAKRLTVLGPLVRPLVELHWTQDVARWTKLDLDEESLRTHLFGSARTTFPPRLRRDLVDLQNGRCFYCDEPLTTRADVDHFLAWSRWPNDAAENLVVADACNGHKRDHLAARPHLDRWFDRNHRRAADLTSIAGGAGWLSAPDRTLGLARSAYLTLAAGTPLWLEGGEFVEADGPIDIGA